MLSFLNQYVCNNIFFDYLVIFVRLKWFFLIGMAFYRQSS